MLHLMVPVEFISSVRKYKDEHVLPESIGGYRFTKTENWICEVPYRTWEWLQAFPGDFRKVPDGTNLSADSADELEALKKRVKKLELDMGKLKKNESKSE